MASIINAFLRLASIFVFNLFYRVTVKGQENIPLQGKVILAGNHCSYLDPMVLFYVSPRKFYAVVSKQIYHIRWLTWVFKATSCIPTNGSSSGAVSALLEDKAILIFPEGGCSCSYQMQKVHNGVSVLALKTAAAVVPVSIRGTLEAWPIGKFFPRFFRRIEVRFSKPILFQQVSSEIIPQEILEATTNKIIEQIKALLNSE
jgi:1-acyl-sn-glycerol-3-phosphate acyltransferase